MPQSAALPQATDTRELIIGSAYVCFRRQGFQKTTIVDIARLANVSRSTIYEYFRDKAAIMEAAPNALPNSSIAKCPKRWTEVDRCRKSSAKPPYS